MASLEFLNCVVYQFRFDFANKDLDHFGDKKRRGGQ